MSARARAARLLALPRNTAAPRRPALEPAPPPPLTRCNHTRAHSACALMRLIRRIDYLRGDASGLGRLFAQ